MKKNGIVRRIFSCALVLILTGQIFLLPASAAETERAGSGASESTLSAFLSDGTIRNTDFGIVKNDSGASAARQNVAAFQKAFDQAAAQGIKEIKVEPGHYYVDTSHTFAGHSSAADNSIFIPSDMTVCLNGATFQQISNAQPGYAIFAVKNAGNVKLYGGELLGDKKSHEYTAGSSHEWGFGIAVMGSRNVIIEQVKISQMTGDGIYVGGVDAYLASGGKISENIAITNCEIFDCRRQGISVIGADQVDIGYCSIYDIDGTAPGYFIDLENELDWPIQNVVIHHNRFGKQGSPDREAVLVHRGSKNIILEGNTVEGNISLMYTDKVRISDNIINGTVGIAETADTDQVEFQMNTGKITYWDLSPTAKDIVSFTAGNHSSWSINRISGDITMVVPLHENLDSLETKVGLSGGAAVSPGSGSVQNLNHPVSYVVTGSSGQTKTHWVRTYRVSSFTQPFVLSPETIALDLQEKPAQSISVYLASGAAGASYAEVSSSDSSVAALSTTTVTESTLVTVYGRQRGSASVTVRFFNEAGEMLSNQKTYPVTVSGEERTGLSELTVCGKDMDGRILYTHSMQERIGSTKTVTAETKGGYTLIGSGTRDVIITGNAKNTVTFYYDVNPVYPELETERHISYLSGFSDGSVRPGDKVTRAQVAVIFFRLIKDENKNQPIAGRFSDVAAGAWYAQAVVYLESLGILSGYPDGTFKPHAHITRGELTAVASRFYSMTGGTNPFSDVSSGSWSTAYIINAYEKGWIAGYPNGTFRPGASITRAETVSVVNNMLMRRIRKENIPAGANRFHDLEDIHWAFSAIMEASCEHEYERLPDGTELWTSFG